MAFATLSDWIWSVFLNWVFKGKRWFCFAKNDVYCLHQLARLPSGHVVSCILQFCIARQIASHWLCVGKTRIFLPAQMPLTQCESPPFRGIWQSWVGFSDPLSHNPHSRVSKTHQPFFLQGLFSAVECDWFWKGGYTVWFSVLGCSDPLSVRSVAFCPLLAAALKTSLRGMDFASV